MFLFDEMLRESMLCTGEGGKHALRTLYNFPYIVWALRTQMAGR